MSSRLPLFVVLAALGAACSRQDGLIDPGDAEPSRAFGTWQPGSHDTCTREQHDAYAVIGPDGKAYPVWHPPTGPGGCSFGHEHGRDPRGSKLYDDSQGLPFGYANEVLALADPAHPRDEDHVGHKIEWENDLELPVVRGGSAASTVTCDILLKLHQGTHSKDALTNNLHELVYHLRCQDRTELHVTMLAAIGRPGQFGRSCTQTEYIDVGPPTPANSPIGVGARLIPDRECIERHLLVPPGQQSNYDAALSEIWRTLNSVTRADGQTIAFFNPYFSVRLPSRFYDSRLVELVGRPMAVCYEVSPTGERASGGACAASTGDAALTDVGFDDPRSVFNGTDRSVEINEATISNSAGPEIWYTDAFGQGGRPEAFPGSIPQRVARVDGQVGFQLVGPSIGMGREYAGEGVRSPN